MFVENFFLVFGCIFLSAGFSANRWSMELGNYTFERLAEMAVEQADALIKELGKPKN